MSLLRSRMLGLGAVMACGLVMVAGAQAPGAAPMPPQGAPGARGPQGPRPKPTNIQALPKDISGDDVRKVMRQYEQQLGVECEYCHAQNPTTHKNDFASDANPMKEEARLMIKMTANINEKYLATLGSGPDTPLVSCGTCHRGMAHPPDFVPKPQAPRVPPAGAPAAGAMPGMAH